MLYFIDRVQEGIRELEPLRDRQDVNVCALLALIMAHKKAATPGTTPHNIIA